MSFFVSGLETNHVGVEPSGRQRRLSGIGQPIHNGVMSKRHPTPAPDDTLRSDLMRRVRQRQTPIEKAVAAILRKLGKRYRLNSRSLPGSPDLSNKTERWAIFVNGCFWHGHKNCGKTKVGAQPMIPRHNATFWREKLAANRRRDSKKCRDLRALGFRVIIVWECDLNTETKLENRLRRLLIW
jgi:DNA mismatch endonuclease (patch repair protein)